jgi:Icc-related predicted phosphoesterase
MSKLNITLISDTHNKHNELTRDMIGGDILIHAGDISSVGYLYQVRNFLEWFDKQPYTHKIFIAGNHDFCFETHISENAVVDILNKFGDVTYLMDNSVEIEGVKIYGSPWQARFYDWAFNLDRNSNELNSKWELIPDDTDILITHGPAWGYVDKVIGKTESLGCELLVRHIKDRVKPTLHVCGHIHSGRGHRFDGVTNFINASVLDEEYNYRYKPLNITLDTETKQITFN